MALFSGFILSCLLTAPDSIPYRLDQPTQTMLLEDERLREISGIGFTKTPGILAGISDEKGEIFLIDLSKNGRLENTIFFKDKGDFEDVTPVGQCFYAVKSDGTVYEIGCPDKSGKYHAEAYKTGLGKVSDVEGMCYDSERKCLLLAAKGNPKNDSLRYVWAFDLIEKELLEQPAYTINPNHVNRVLPYQENEKSDFFSPSAIAIHPITRELYVISTALKRLVVMDKNTGAVKEAVYLDKKHLPQPEGIEFDATGNLFISSEGKDGQGRILKFDYLDK
jgi:uncharacterized protein YjiK